MDRLQTLMAALEKEPDDPFLLYGIAHEQAKQGKTREAVEFFDRCIAKDPHYCYAYYHKARVLEESGDTGAAIEATRRGITQARACGDQKALSELNCRGCWMCSSSGTAGG